MSFLRALFIVAICGAMIAPWVATHCSSASFVGSGSEGPMCIERTITIPEALRNGSEYLAILPVLAVFAFFTLRVFRLAPSKFMGARMATALMMLRKAKIIIPLENFFSLGGLARKVDP